MQNRRHNLIRRFTPYLDIFLDFDIDAQLQTQLSNSNNSKFEAISNDNSSTSLLISRLTETKSRVQTKTKGNISTKRGNNRNTDVQHKLTLIQHS